MTDDFVISLSKDSRVTFIDQPNKNAWSAWKKLYPYVNRVWMFRSSYYGNKIYGK